MRHAVFRRSAPLSSSPVKPSQRPAFDEHRSSSPLALHAGTASGDMHAASPAAMQMTRRENDPDIVISVGRCRPPEQIAHGCLAQRTVDQEGRQHEHEEHQQHHQREAQRVRLDAGQCRIVGDEHR